MGIITVGLNENNRASSTRIAMMQPPGGTSNIFSEMYVNEVRSESAASNKPCHSETSSVCSEEQAPAGIPARPKKPYRLTSAIVLGDETPDDLVPALRRTSIKVVQNSTRNPLATDSVETTSPVSSPSPPPSESAPSPPPPAAAEQQHAAPVEVVKVAAAPSPSPQPESPPPASPQQQHEAECVTPPPPAPVTTPTSRQPAQNGPPFSNSDFGCGVPKLTRRQPPGGHCTRLW